MHLVPAAHNAPRRCFLSRFLLKLERAARLSPRLNILAALLNEHARLSGFDVQQRKRANNPPLRNVALNAEAAGDDLPSRNLFSFPGDDARRMFW